MIKFDKGEFGEMMANDAEYQEKANDYEILVEKIRQYNEKLRVDIDNAEADLETRATEFSYSRGFHDGIRFLLETLGGKDPITLD